MAKGKNAAHGSGKTLFNRIKASGQSWIALRDEHIKTGRWKDSKNLKAKDYSDSATT